MATSFLGPKNGPFGIPSEKAEALIDYEYKKTKQNSDRPMHPIVEEWMRHNQTMREDDPFHHESFMEVYERHQKRKDIAKVAQVSSMLDPRPGLHDDGIDALRQQMMDALVHGTGVSQTNALGDLNNASNVAAAGHTSINYEDIMRMQDRMTYQEKSFGNHFRDWLMNKDFLYMWFKENTDNSAMDLDKKLIKIIEFYIQNHNKSGNAILDSINEEIKRMKEK